ncbi:uncharacterized protein LOC131930691 [Physella acuta]|uniref:uncharacterized protein LOC131930691 n=1 Tax=Physella acuta TaxID=109671 RepID=UPI0027DD311F|nr:uncharacterized protein LOC131930691 [Physella acuta]XP_059143259.1 uncharacterized protein LOC131930691 [Physella acuta]
MVTRKRWMNLKSCTRNRSRVCLVIVTVISVYWVLTVLFPRGRFIKWKSLELPPRDTSVKHFVKGRDGEIYMYSAWGSSSGQPEGGAGAANDSYPLGDAVEIVVTTLDKSRVSYDCCVLYQNLEMVYVISARVYFRYYVTKMKLKDRFKEYFEPTFYVARQFSCRAPVLTEGVAPSRVTLTSKGQCSTDLKDYLPVQYPKRHRGQLALCAKIAHSGGLDPIKVIEWFELQKILGVDKILIYDMGNPASLNRLFEHYQRQGILDRQPYELPGEPKGRSLQEPLKRTRQFIQDETMAVLECRQRMAGYDYVISHDVDEMIVPRQEVTLKQFLQDKRKQHPQSAGFYFFTQFFLTTWEPTNPEENLMVKRYRKATPPRWECYKYVYLPSRVYTSLTHEFFPKSYYTGTILTPEEATLHHYRACPFDTWGTCTVYAQTDDVMKRYVDLDERVRRVREVTST